MWLARFDIIFTVAAVVIILGTVGIVQSELFSFDLVHDDADTFLVQGVIVPKRVGDHASRSFAPLDDEDEATLAAIDEGIRQANEGQLVSSDEVRKLIPKWISKFSTPQQP